MADPPPHHCKDCGLVFDSGKSLDVHLHYHKENLLSKWAQQQQTGATEESNNNHVKKNGRAGPTTAAAVPADSSDSADAAYYHHHHHHAVTVGPSYEDVGYVLGGGTGFPQMPRTPTPNSCSSPSPHPVNSYRYHPYQQQYSPADHVHRHRNGHVTTSSSSSSPQQCDKCGFVCESGAALMDHVAVAHPPTPAPEHHSLFVDHPELNVKVEPSQAEILDLDSHKVHVYQPPPVAPSLVSWANEVVDKERFRQSHNGSSPPDCYGNVSTTTTEGPADLPMAAAYRYDHLSQQQHISSSRLAMGQQQPQQQPPPQQPPHTKMLKPPAGNGGAWKANDARRPKTYNCSACNKWFTSSGHLKRHYNTTLHKNAVKQSGAPDPATMPISSHHHPHKDPTYLSPHSPAAAEPLEEPPPQQPPQQQPPPPPPPAHLMNHHFLPSPPNLMAGPPEVTGGLLLHTTPYQEPSPTPPTPTFLPFHHTPTYPDPQHPNFLPPHVSTDPQVTTSSISGNLNLLDLHNYLMEMGKREQQQQQQPLPSFAQLQQNSFAPVFSSFHPVVVSSSDSDVGGLNPQHLSSGFDSSLFRAPSPGPSVDEDSYGFDDVRSPADGDDISSTQDHGPCLAVVKADDDRVSSTIQHSPPPAAPPPPPPPQQQAAVTVHKCVDCDKVFNKACYLTQHNKSFHSGVKPYKCERCGKRFTAEYLHLEHLSKHAGDKPYKCEICPKQFNHKTDLRRHMCLHTGDKPYACEFCGKGFIRKDHMLKHCETHKRRPAGGGGRGYKHGAAAQVDSFKVHAAGSSNVLASPSHNPSVQTLQMVM